MHLGLRRRARDAVDTTYLSIIDRRDLPPLSLRQHVGPAQEYEKTPAEYTAYFRLLCNLAMDESVLDIGSGTGRFAQYLYDRPNFFHGRYRGFDVDRRAVRWANRHVARQGRDLEFDYLDLANGHYNPGGALQSDTVRFPYHDAEFDFAFAMSVFTHLTRPTTVNYLRELGRVLRPGGRALLSFVFLPPEQTTLSPLATERLYHDVLVANRLDHSSSGTVVKEFDGIRTATPHAPEIVTFYDVADVRALVSNSGLEVEAIHEGTWGNPDGGPAFQDLLILRKP